MAHASKRDYETAFAGLDFPTSRAAVINRARDNGGLDREVYRILDKIPDRSYESVEELQQAVREAYIADGEPADSLPL